MKGSSPVLWPPGRKLQALEGLRGGASFIVLLDHLNLGCLRHGLELRPTALPDAPQWIKLLLRAIFEPWTDGVIAVWTFWVMSGFVLSYKFVTLSQEQKVGEARQYLLGSAVRRYPRLILPVLASVLMAYIFLAAGLMYNQRVATLFGRSADGEWLGFWYQFTPDFGAALKCALLDSFFFYDRATTYNSNLWTLQNEMYGSIFLYLFLLFFGGKLVRGWAYLICGVFIFCIHQNWLNAFLIGILLCDVFVLEDVWCAKFAEPTINWIQRVRMNRAVAVAGSFGVLLLIGLDAECLGWKLHGLLACLVVLWTLFSYPVQSVFKMKAFLYLGSISFSLYVIHVALICSFSCWFYLAFYQSLGAKPAMWMSAFLTLIISVGGAHVMRELCDEPGIRASKWLSSRMFRKRATINGVRPGL